MTPKLYIELNPMSQVPEKWPVRLRYRMFGTIYGATIHSHADWRRSIREYQQDQAELLDWYELDAAPVPAVSVERLMELAHHERDKQAENYGDCETAAEHAHAAEVLEQLINESRQS